MITNSILATPANLSTLRGFVSSSSARSAWSRGVRAYALDLLDSIEELSNYEMNNYGEYLVISEEVALNGAGSWSNYAAGGCGLVYNYSIAATLCNPSEFRKCKGGQLAPNSRETWIDVEARALFQAWRLIAENLGKLS